MKKCNKIICWVGGILLGLLIISILGGSIYMLDFALYPAKNKGRDYAKQYRLMCRRYPWAVSWMDSVQRTKALRDTFVVMKNEQRGLLLADSTRLHALIIPAPKKDPRTVVLVPGYTDNAVDMLHFACFYNRELGMNVVIPGSSTPMARVGARRCRWAGTTATMCCGGPRSPTVSSATLRVMRVSSYMAGPWAVPRR